MDISRPCQREKLIPLLPWRGFDRRAIISEWTRLCLRPLSHRGANICVIAAIYLSDQNVTWWHYTSVCFRRHAEETSMCLFVCWSLTSLCHSNGHIETMAAREINPFTALTRIRSQFLRTQWSTSNHSEWTRLRLRPLSHRGWQKRACGL